MGRIKQIIIFGLIFLVSAVGTYWYKKNSRQLQDNPYGSLGGDFTLKQYKKGEVSLSDFKGQAVILYFGFTSCPDICPLSLSYLSHALELLSSEEKKKIVPLFISVDWKSDTPQSVAEYTEFFSKSIIGLTGDKNQVDDVIKKYGAYYQFTPLKDSSLEYTVDHTSRFYLIDDLGRLRNTLNDKMEKTEFVQKIKNILKEF